MKSQTLHAVYLSYPKLLLNSISTFICLSNNTNEKVRTISPKVNYENWINCNGTNLLSQITNFEKIWQKPSNETDFDLKTNEKNSKDNIFQQNSFSVS
jgi:hypothetical protein